MRSLAHSIRLELTSALRQLFGDWKSPVQVSSAPTSGYKDDQGKTESLATSGQGLMAVVMAAGTLKISEVDLDYPALVLGNYIAGGGFL